MFTRKFETLDLVVLDPTCLRRSLEFSRYNYSVDLSDSLSFEKLEPKVLSVSQFWREIYDALTPLSSEVHRVRCTVSSSKKSQAGHIFFDMVEAEEIGNTSRTVIAKIPAVIWRDQATAIQRELNQRSLSPFEDDLEVIVIGRLNLHAIYGMKFQVTAIDYDALRKDELIRLEEIRRILRSEGIWDANRLLKPPYLCTDIALVTSASGVVKRDFLNPLVESGVKFSLKLYPTSVSGPYAVDDLAQTLARAGGGGHDLVVLIRGGGSTGELSVFNEEKVVRAVAGCKTPIWCAIGHSTDSVLVNEVANRYFDVPQSVAKELVGAAQEFLSSITLLAERVIRVVEQCLEREVEFMGRVNMAATMALDSMQVRMRSSFVETMRRVSDAMLDIVRREQQELLKVARAVHNKSISHANLEEMEISRNQSALAYGSRKIFDSEQTVLVGLLSQAERSDPEEILRKGFAIVGDKDDQWIKTAAQARRTKIAKILFGDGVTLVREQEE